LADRILAACTLLVAGVYLYATHRLPAMDIGDPLGPKAFPVLLGILFAVAGALLLVETWRRGAPVVSDVPAPIASRPRDVAIVAAATAIFFALLEPLGYLVAVASYLLALTLWLHRRRPLTCIAVAVLFSLASYALFVKVLNVSLAKGVFSF